jgi:hypothetical protein
MSNEEQSGTELRMSAQRALLGAVPSSLRAVSLEWRGDTIHFRAVFATDATEDDVELVSIAATEVIADFVAPATIHEEWIHLDPPAKPEHLKYLVFLRAEKPYWPDDEDDRERWPGTQTFRGGAG